MSDTSLLLAWINTHDCGVTPTGVLNHDGAIVIRIAWSNPLTGRDGFDETIVHTYQEARAVLGY